MCGDFSWVLYTRLCSVHYCIFLFKLFRSAQISAGPWDLGKGATFPEVGRHPRTHPDHIGALTGYKTTSDGQLPRGVSVSASMLHSTVINRSIQGDLIHSIGYTNGFKPGVRSRSRSRSRSRPESWQRARSRSRSRSRSNCLDSDSGTFCWNL